MIFQLQWNLKCRRIKIHFNLQNFMESKNQQQLKETLEENNKDTIYCPYDNIAMFLCNNTNCDACAIVCSIQKCKCHSQHSSHCEFIELEKTIKQIMRKKGKISKSGQQAVKRVEKIYDQIIERLMKQKESFRQNNKNCGLSQNQIFFFERLRKKQKKEIKGSLVKSLSYGCVMNESLVIQISDNKVGQFWNDNRGKIQSFMSELKVLQDSVFTSTHFKKITQFLGLTSCNFKLLYRASENKFSVAKFHQKCDGYPNTVTIARTQFGKIIGGFTKLPWNSHLVGQDSNDIHGKSFLFSLTHNQKYPIKDREHSIHNFQGLGPAFGAGYDFSIMDQANLKSNSLCDFPTSYRRASQNSSPLSFTGAPKTSFVKFQEWEVFQVIEGKTKLVNSNQ